MIKKTLFFTAIFALFCLIFNAFYTFPSADDFSYYVKQQNYGFWAFQKWHYLNWGGRYIPNAVLGYFSFDENGLYLYRMIAATVISTLFLAFYQFSSAFFEKKNGLLITSLLFLTYCFSLYSISQEFYWMPGSITYTISITLSLLIWSLLHKINNNFMFFVCLLACIILNGTNEVAMVFFNASLLLYAIFRALNSQKIAKRIYFLLAISIFCMLFSILAPGNSLRSLSENNIDTHNLVFTIPRAIYRSYTFFYEKFFLFFIVGFLIYQISNFNGLKLKLSEKFPLAIKTLSFLFPFTILISGVGLSYYATGRIPPERTVNTISFYFLIAVIFSFLFYKANFNKKEINHQEKWLSGLCFSVILVLFFVPNELKRNCEDLFSGRSKQFSIEMNEREKFIKNTPENDIKVKKIRVLPISIFFKDITADPNNFFNYYYAQFYHKKTVIVDE